ncbi:MAG: alkyl hydroperoxide reductase [Odoribacter sp. 43_10]|nr:MAG: alkyl hydroperoxide reductase [Odoribacter sp. 43_10]
MKLKYVFSSLGILICLSVFADGVKPAKVGEQSPDFQFADKNGKMYSLKDFKGQYLRGMIFVCINVISGIIECKIGLIKNAIEKLKKKNIAFIGIATDLDKDEWIKFIEEKALKGTQLIMDRKWISFMHSYDVATIPRYILLDKEGKIINLNMPRPSNPQCMKILKSLKR